MPKKRASEIARYNYCPYSLLYEPKGEMTSKRFARGEAAHTTQMRDIARSEFVLTHRMSYAIALFIVSMLIFAILAWLALT